MRLPNQAPGVNRADRVGAAKAAGVSPALFGISNDTLLKGAKTGLSLLNSIVNG